MRTKKVTRKKYEYRLPSGVKGTLHASSKSEARKSAEGSNPKVKKSKIRIKHGRGSLWEKMMKKK